MVRICVYRFGFEKEVVEEFGKMIWCGVGFDYHVILR